MDDVIAVEVELDNGELRYFLTWGRIQHTVDPEMVTNLVLTFSRSCSLGDEPIAARLCGALRVAAESAVAPYFYECLLRFSQPIPFGDSYAQWKADRAEAMAAGREIAYCGSPGPGLE